MRRELQHVPPRLELLHVRAPVHFQVTAVELEDHDSRPAYVCQAEGRRSLEADVFAWIAAVDEQWLPIIEFLRPGDELVVTRLDRLGRDTRDVLNLIHECEQKDA